MSPKSTLKEVSDPPSSHPLPLPPPPRINSNWMTLPDFMLKQDTKYKRSWAAPVPNIGLLGNCMFSLCTEENVKHVLKVS